MDPWIAETAAELAHRIPREIEALVGVSSPSGDVAGAEECIAVCALLLPEEAEIERIPCSSEGHAQDTVARLYGSGSKRILLLGHVDTVVARPPTPPAPRPAGARADVLLVGGGAGGGVLGGDDGVHVAE
jgi:glutamate carboxypeptidase